MEKYIYTVNVSYGSYDDYCNCPVAAFLSLTDAQKYRDKVHAEHMAEVEAAKAAMKVYDDWYEAADWTDEEPDIDVDYDALEYNGTSVDMIELKGHNIWMIQ